MLNIVPKFLYPHLKDKNKSPFNPVNPTESISGKHLSDNDSLFLKTSAASKWQSSTTQVIKFSEKECEYWSEESGWIELKSREPSWKLIPLYDIPVYGTINFGLNDARKVHNVLSFDWRSIIASKLTDRGWGGLEKPTLIRYPSFSSKKNRRIFLQDYASLSRKSLEWVEVNETWAGMNLDSIRNVRSFNKS